MSRLTNVSQKLSKVSHCYLSPPLNSVLYCITTKSSLSVRKLQPRTYTANLLVEHLSYTMRFNFSLVALLLYALKAQPVTSAGRNQKNVYVSHQHHSLAMEAREATGRKPPCWSVSAIVVSVMEKGMWIEWHRSKGHEMGLKAIQRKPQYASSETSALWGNNVANLTQYIARRIHTS